MKETIDNIAIIGMGLMGASFAAALHKAHPSMKIFGVDVSASSVAKAVQKQWITSGSTPDGDAFREFMQSECELVVLAIPVDVCRDYFTWFDEWGYKGIITDTASTKNKIMSIANEVLQEPWRFLPGHPMCGSEKVGIDGANPDMFNGSYWIICPSEKNPSDYIPLLHSLLTSIDARVINIPPEEHDNAVAIVSHIPHLMAASQVNLACNHADPQGALFRLAAGGFKDSTRIAAGSSKLWTGIVFDNAESIMANLEEISQIIQQFLDAIRHMDRATVTELLERASQARRSLPVAWVPSSEKLFEVRVPMHNKSGVVAEVTTIASKVGCNIQSIEIDHVTESTAVLSMVLTDEGDIGKLSTELLMAGYQVSFAPLSPKEHSHDR